MVLAKYGGHGENSGHTFSAALLTPYVLMESSFLFDTIKVGIVHCIY